MDVSGLIADRITGKPLAGVTIWSYSNDGQTANVIGYSDSDGNFEIPVNGLTVAFEKDGYTGLQTPDDMINEGGTITLTQSMTAMVAKNFPPWLIEVLIVIGIYLATTKGKRK